MKRVLLLTDSLGCPRDEIPVGKTWVDLILTKYSGSPDVYFYTYCERGLSTNDLKMDYLEGLNPDIIICQIGIVDACRRAFSKRFIRLVSVVRPLSMLVNSFAKKYHRFLTSVRDIHYASEPVFQKKIESIVSYAGEVIFVSIAPPGDFLEKQVYNVTSDIEKYNGIIDDVCNKHDSCVVIDPFRQGEVSKEFLLEDGHHLNEYGEEIVFSMVDSCFQSKLGRSI